MATQQASSATAFVDSLGVNAHIDFQNYGYQNFGVTEAAIQYLGLTNLRDDPENPADVGPNGWWQQVAGATGAKFDAFMAEGSVGQMQSDLGRAQQLGGQGILNYIEGGNEEDDSFATSNGNSLGAAAAFQPQVYAAAHALGLPAINMSFGQGWTSANDYAGNYDKVGNLAGSADYANAHTYPNGSPLSTIQLLNRNANMAANGRPVMNTEFGYDTNTTDATQAAKWDLMGTMDAYAAGDVKTYFYALFDDGSGSFGLMNQDGSPKAPGLAIHNLTTLLADTGGAAAAFAPGTLDYTLTGGSGDNTLLMQKSDGSYWLSVWNETAGGHTDTLTLGAVASQILVFDPLTGTSAVQTLSDTATAQIQVPDHPVLIEVINPGTAAGADGAIPGQVTTPGGATTPGTTTPDGTTAGAATPGTTTPDGTTAGAAGTPQDLALAVPASLTVTAGTATPVPGVAIDDAWATTMGGAMALNVYDNTGTITIAGQTFGPGGANVPYGMLSGTAAELNVDLATLSYTPGASTDPDTLTVDVWNQAGVEVTKTIQVSSGTAAAPGDTTPPPDGATPGGTTPGGTTPAAPTPTPDVSIPDQQASYVATVSNQTIGATAGDHAIFIGGTGNTLNATGGTETVQAFQGGNNIATGAGNDAIYYAGTGNVINAGAGANTLYDSGSNNTIVLPGAGQGTDQVFGWVTQNGDQFDLRGLLASTQWDGDASTIGDFLAIGTNDGGDSVISVDPTGQAGGASTAVATLVGAGAVPLSTLLSHSITS